MLRGGDCGNMTLARRYRRFPTSAASTIVRRTGLTPRLHRPDEPDIHPARVFRRDEHRVLAGVADSARGRRDAVVGHPFRGGVHAAGAIQNLERSRAAAGEGVGGDARTVRLREAEGGRTELEYRHVGVDDGAALQLGRRYAEQAGVQSGGTPDGPDPDVDAPHAPPGVWVPGPRAGGAFSDEAHLVEGFPRLHPFLI